MSLVPLELSQSNLVTFHGHLSLSAKFFCPQDKLYIMVLTTLVPGTMSYGTHTNALDLSSHWPSVELIPSLILVMQVITQEYVALDTHMEVHAPKMETYDFMVERTRMKEF